MARPSTLTGAPPGPPSTVDTGRLFAQREADARRRAEDEDLAAREARARETDTGAYDEIMRQLRGLLSEDVEGAFRRPAAAAAAETTGRTLRTLAETGARAGISTGQLMGETAPVVREAGLAQAEIAQTARQRALEHRLRTVQGMMQAAALDPRVGQAEKLELARVAAILQAQLAREGFAFQAGETALERAWRTGERLGGETFQRGERLGSEAFQAREAARQRVHQRAERIDAQNWRTDEAQRDRLWQAYMAELEAALGRELRAEERAWLESQEPEAWEYFLSVVAGGAGAFARGAGGALGDAVG